jgi:Ras-related protein Rab-5C
VDGKAVKCQLWDTAGQERYLSLAPMYYRKASAAIIMYDITSAPSFERLHDWIRELADNGPDGIVVACVGNKLDLKGSREVPEHDARAFAGDENALYFETSARTGENVSKVFEELARQVLRSNGDLAHDPARAIASEDPDVVGDLSRDSKGGGPAKKGGCC